MWSVEKYFFGRRARSTLSVITAWHVIDSLKNVLVDWSDVMKALIFFLKEFWDWECGCERDVEAAVAVEQSWVVAVELNSLLVGQKHRHLGAVFARIEDLFDLILVGIELYYVSDTPYDKDALARNRLRYIEIKTGKMRTYASAQNFFDKFVTFFGIIKAVIKLFFLILHQSFRILLLQKLSSNNRDRYQPKLYHTFARYV